jgi:hypothetical protein
VARGAAAFEDWLLAGPTLAERLGPLAETDPAWARDPRARRWAALLVGEAPDEPEPRAFAVAAHAAAGALAAAEAQAQLFLALAPERGPALDRLAALWAALGDDRRACATRHRRLVEAGVAPEDVRWTQVRTCAGLAAEATGAPP